MQQKRYTLYNRQKNKTISRSLIYKPFMFLLCNIFLLFGCTQKEDINDTNIPVAVNFHSSSNRSAIPISRTTNGGTEWVSNDEIGIFMLNSGDPLSAQAILDGAENIKYLASPGSPASEATFSPAYLDETLYFPHNGMVDFIAYYPHADFGTEYGEITTDYIYKVSIASQSTEQEQAKVDILYSNNATNKSRTNPEINLGFKHIMSKLVINLIRGVGMESADFTTLEVSTFSFATRMEVSLIDGSLKSITGGDTPISPLIKSSSSYAATVELIVAPGETAGITHSINFNIEGQPFTWSPHGEFMEKGKIQTYDITVNKTGLTVGNVTILDWNQKDNGTSPVETIREGTVFIPPGTFMMGSPESEYGHRDDEKQHKVTFTKGFYMSKHPVTIEQYCKFLNLANVGGWGMNDTVRYFVEGYGLQHLFVVQGTYQGTPVWDYTTLSWIPPSSIPNSASRPMTFVTWYGAKAYADWAGGSLPTEAQWEYACRAGTVSPYSVDDESLIEYYAWYDNNAGDMARPVATWLPNPWGLYDMHGNVYEWVWDWDDENYGLTPEELARGVIDPTGPATGTEKIRRGGSFYEPYTMMRSAYRDRHQEMKSKKFDTGFRIVFNVD